MWKETLQQKNNLENTTDVDLAALQKKTVSTTLENLWTKTKNIMESVGSVLSSFKEKLTSNSRTIVPIIEALKSFKVFDMFFGTTNEDGTPNVRNVMLQKWLWDVYTVEYSLDKKPYKKFVAELWKRYDNKNIFTEEVISDQNKIQEKITDFISTDDNKDNFKELFRKWRLDWVVDPSLISTLLKDNTVWLLATDFFDAEWKLLGKVDEEKINNLIDLIFKNDTLKKSLQNISIKNLDSYKTDKTKDKRIKSNADIAFLIFGFLCKPQYTENIALYNTLPSELVKVETTKKKEDVVVEKTNTTVQIAKTEKENPVKAIQVDEKQEQKEEIYESKDLLNNDTFIHYIKEEIFFTESGKNYWAVNLNDHWSASIWLIQFNWNASNAPELLKKMYFKNQEYFDQKLSSSSRYDKFKKYLSKWSDRKWAIWTKVDKGQFAQFMESQDMKDIMDKEVDVYVKRYINECTKRWITNPKMITYLCRLQNFWPKPFQEVIWKLENKNSLEELREVTLAYMYQKEFVEKKENYIWKTKNYTEAYTRIDQSTDNNIWLA